MIEASRPQEFADFATEIQPHDERVFCGAYDPDAKPVGVVERIGAAFTRLPAVRKSLPAGDFRDWPAIDAWAAEIARELQAPALATGLSGALLNTAQLEDKTWFIVLLVLGLPSFGFVAMVAYVIAGPDGTRHSHQKGVFGTPYEKNGVTVIPAALRSIAKARAAASTVRSAA